MAPIIIVEAEGRDVGSRCRGLFWLLCGGEVHASGQEDALHVPVGAEHVT